jgi:hypothetical protein
MRRFLDLVAITVWLSVAWGSHRRRVAPLQFSSQFDQQIASNRWDMLAPADGREAPDNGASEQQTRAGPKPTPETVTLHSVFGLHLLPPPQPATYWCVICLDNEQDSTQTVTENNIDQDSSARWWTLSCTHAYHAECILRWSQFANRCPLCAAPLWTSALPDNSHSLATRYD